MKKPTLSIIVAVYQTEKYLKECLDSILRQSFRDYELILIDDGSTDSSGLICDEYAKKDDRIIVIHQENKGQSSAKNLGLDISKGSYITFIDSDDIYLRDDYLQLHFDSMREFNATISRCTALCFNDDYDKKDSFVFYGLPKKYYSGRELFMEELAGKVTIGSINIFVFAANYFKGIRFPVGRVAEDNAIIHRLIYDCDRIATVNYRMYGYRWRNDSSDSISNMQNLYIGSYYAYKDRIEFFKEKNDKILFETTSEGSKYRLVKLFMTALVNTGIDKIPQEIRPSTEDIYKYYQGVYTE